MSRDNNYDDSGASLSNVELCAELLSCIEGWAERLKDCQNATLVPMPAEFHVQGQANSIALTLMEMSVVLSNNGAGTNPEVNPHNEMQDK